MGGKSLAGVRGAITRLCIENGHLTPNVTGYLFALLERQVDLSERLLEHHGVDVGRRLENPGDGLLLEFQAYLYEQINRPDRDTLDIVGPGEMPYGLRDDGEYLAM